MAKAWTEDETRRLRELAKEGASALDISIDLNRPRSGVISKAAALGIKLTRTGSYGRLYTEEEDDTIREMHAAGHDFVAISRALGRHEGSAYRRAVYLGLHTPKTLFPDKAARPKPEKEETVVRKCLKCRKPFETTRYIFRCKQCLNAADRYGEGMT